MFLDKLNDNLPKWDLTDLYSGVKSEQLTNDISNLFKRAESLNQLFESKISEASTSSFLELITEFQSIKEGVDKFISFSYLTYCTDMDDQNKGKFFQNMQEKATEISSKILFVKLEISRLDDNKIATLTECQKVSFFKPWIMDVRAERNHQLSDDLEKLLNEKQLISSAWVRLFDQLISKLRFYVDDKELTITEIFDFLSDNSEEKRRKAGDSIGKTLSKNIQSFALITNTLAKDKEIEDRWRNFSEPIYSRNLSNRVENEIVNTLISSVEEAYPRISHRYYKLKAKWMGVKKLSYWDRNAPISKAQEKEIPWADAVDTVSKAYRDFSPTLANIGQQFFDNEWIHAQLLSGKAPGAFAHPTVPSAHPYLLLNYQGKNRDVMTLAHELGHGIHQVLAGDCGHLMSETPLTLAETASVFGEQLTFQAMLKCVDDIELRKVMLAAKVEDMLNTVVRQVAFCQFEQNIHLERRSGELTTDRICEIWLESQSKSLGPSVDISRDYKYFWAYIPHFIHSPFYVYAYAFGDCLVNALYGAYLKKPEGFEPLYIDLLKAGGTLSHKELLSPFGLNAEKKQFWTTGLNVIEAYIDELSGI